MTTYIFYHMMSPTAPCPDGIFSAGVARQYFGNSAEHIGCCYVKAGETPPEHTIPRNGDWVYVLDFSFEAWVIQDWITRGVNVRIIDHHENKMLELLGKRELADMIVYNNNKCGAILTWEYFFSDKPIPAILGYIDDRDRWQHKLPYTKEIHAAVGALGRNFDLVDMLLPLSQDQLVNIFGKLGKREVEAREKTIRQLANSYNCDDKGIFVDYFSSINEGDCYTVSIVELEASDAWACSEVCEYLYNKLPGADFTACYYIENGKEKWSLLSNPNGNNFDVSKVARSFGGGGHHNAAGFTKE